MRLPLRERGQPVGRVGLRPDLVPVVLEELPQRSADPLLVVHYQHAARDGAVARAAHLALLRARSAHCGVLYSVTIPPPTRMSPTPGGSGSEIAAGASGPRSSVLSICLTIRGM